MAKRGRKSKQINTADCEKYAQRGLSNREIALMVGVSQSVLYERMLKKPEIQEAIERGRATMVAACAEVVLKNAVGQMDANGKVTVPSDARLCLEVLRKHGNLWGDKAQTQVEINGPAQINNIVAAELGPEACARMAKAYLRSRGEA